MAVSERPIPDTGVRLTRRDFPGKRIVMLLFLLPPLIPLVAGPTSQTLVVALYYAVFAAGVRAVQSIDAVAVVYMATTLIWLLVALRFVDPTQVVARGK